MRSAWLLALALALSPGCGAATSRAVRASGAPAAIGPYSHAWEAGGFLFASGQIGLDRSGDLASGGIREQTAAALSNLDRVLRAAGRDRRDVVKTTVFLADLADFEAMNEVYARWFGSHRPARSTVQVAALPRGALVEIELIAR